MQLILSKIVIQMVKYIDEDHRYNMLNALCHIYKYVIAYTDYSMLLTSYGAFRLHDRRLSTLVFCQGCCKN